MKCEKCSKCESCEKSTHRTEEEKKSLTKRLNIIEGQIRGIKQMIEDDRYCADILIQLSAISKSLESEPLPDMLENFPKNSLSVILMASLFIISVT